MEPAGFLAPFLPSACAVVLAGFALLQRRRIARPSHSHRRFEPHRPAHRPAEPARLRGAARASSSSAPRAPAGRCSVIVGDLDGFRAINDRSGHAAGDAALQASRATRSSGSGASTWRPGSAARSSRCCSRRPTSAAPSSWPSGCAAPRTASFADRAGSVTISFGVASAPAHGDDGRAAARRRQRRRTPPRSSAATARSSTATRSRACSPATRRARRATSSSSRP